MVGIDDAAGTVSPIVNPVAEPHAHDDDAERYPPAPRPATLDGKTDRARTGTASRTASTRSAARESTCCRAVRRRPLRRAHRRARRHQPLPVAGAARPCSRREVDVAVCTSADCGSCTSWLMRDLCELERRGIPAVGYTAAIFDEDARFSLKTFGVPEACPLIVPECFSNKTPEQIAEMVDDAMDDVVDVPRPSDRAGLRRAAAVRAHGARDRARARLPRRRPARRVRRDADAASSRNGWSDGLPLVPPTHAKVEAMIAASGRDGDDVVGLFAPGFGIGTVRKIAANAVMAGCAPEVDAGDPGDDGVHPRAVDRPAHVGDVDRPAGARRARSAAPIADEIGMNRGICALGPGSISQVNVVDRPGAAADHDERRPVVSRASPTWTRSARR